MTNPPEFTAVIPLYNGAKYIAATLESVLAQTHKPQQIIVVDDESTDNSAEIARAYPVQLVSQTNQGQSAARNLGISIAQTEWISFLDADDLWMPNHLQEQATAINLHPGADLCYSGRRELVQKSDGEYVVSAPVSLPDPERLKSVLLDRCPFQPSSTSVRRSTIRAIGGFNSAFDCVEDWHMWLRFVQHGSKMVPSVTPSTYYRLNPEGVTNKAAGILAKSKRLVEQVIAPMLPPRTRASHCRRVVSRLEAETSILLRENKQEGALPLMLRSIARSPLHQSRRYKIALHMLLLGSRPRTASR